MHLSIDIARRSGCGRVSGSGPSDRTTGIGARKHRSEKLAAPFAAAAKHQIDELAPVIAVARKSSTRSASWRPALSAA